MAHGFLTWHKTDCDNEHCSDTHYEAVILRDNLRMVLRATKSAYVSGPDNWTCCAYFLKAREHASLTESEDEKGITLCTSPWASSLQHAAAALVSKMDEEFAAIMKVARDLVLQEANPNIK